jgi:hypothetical protein
MYVVIIISPVMLTPEETPIPLKITNYILSALGAIIYISEKRWKLGWKDHLNFKSNRNKNNGPNSKNPFTPP